MDTQSFYNGSYSQLKFKLSPLYPCATDKMSHSRLDLSHLAFIRINSFDHHIWVLFLPSSHLPFKVKEAITLIYILLSFQFHDSWVTLVDSCLLLLNFLFCFLYWHWLMSQNELIMDQYLEKSNINSALQTYCLLIGALRGRRKGLMKIFCLYFPLVSFPEHFTSLRSVGYDESEPICEKSTLL